MIISNKFQKVVVILAFWLLCLSNLNILAQVTIEDYQRADRFSPEAWASGRELGKMVYHGTVVPHWIGKSNRFWYRDYIQGEKNSCW